MSNDELISHKVSRIRRQMGLNQAQFAKELGVSRNYVSMLEGGREPSEQIVKMLDMLERSSLEDPEVKNRLDFTSNSENPSFSAPIFENKKMDYAGVLIGLLPKMTTPELERLLDESIEASKDGGVDELRFARAAIAEWQRRREIPRHAFLESLSEAVGAKLLTINFDDVLESALSRKNFTLNEEPVVYPTSKKIP